MTKSGAREVEGKRYQDIFLSKKSKKIGSLKLGSFIFKTLAKTSVAFPPVVTIL